MHLQTERAGIADLEVEPAVRSALSGVLDIDSGQVDALDGAKARLPCQLECQAACAAADIQDALPANNPGEFDEQRRKPSAPTCQLELVAIAVRSCECR